MNHTYRVIWNEASACFEAVAETASGKGKRSLGKRERKLRAVTLAAGLAAAQALAAPTGGQVSVGQGGITQGGNTTTITQSTPKLAINWQSFGIAGNETVNFVQPGAGAIALNRVLGTEASQILGRLNANGQVFLLNPNGVLFGQSAQVSVGGLVASTLGMSDADFMAGRYVLRDGTGRGGSVRNEGTIRAADGGSIALIGGEVSNTGTLVANLGTVALAAGKQVTLDFSGDGLLKLAVDEGAVNALVHNGGLMQADGGVALLTAKAADALAGTVVNNTGVIRARTLENRGGVIKLLGGFDGGTVQVGGTFDASAPNGGDGGFIDTSGAHVKVAEGTRVSTRAELGKTGTWLIDPADFTIADSGGDISGATLSSNLASSNITILSSSGSNADGDGDIHVNDNVSWGVNTLTLTAARDINIRAVMDATGSSALVMNTGTANGADAGVAGGKVKVAVDPVTGFTGRVNFDRAGTGFLTINGEGYTVLKALGAQGSTTATDLQGMQGNLAGRYALGDNIDAAAAASWNGGAGFAPVGTFTGTFDGLGHSVSNLTISLPTSASRVGLFGQADGATLRNLRLVGGSVQAGTDVGALVGVGTAVTLHNILGSTVVTGTGAGGIAGTLQGGTLTDVHATGNVIRGSSNSSLRGGLVGSSTGIMYDRVSASGAVDGPGANLGGLIGQSSGDTLANARATGNVGAGAVAGNVASAGGLVGWASGTTIQDSQASGAVGRLTAGSTAVGGLAGRMDGGSIVSSHATGAVNGGAQVGGLVGLNSGSIADSDAVGAVTAVGGEVGGLVGRNTGGAIDRSSALGTALLGGVVGGANFVGGLVGYNDGGNITGTTSNPVTATANVTGARSYVGGAVGYNALGILTDVTASGSVQSTAPAVAPPPADGLYVGGLVGAQYGGAITRGRASGAVQGNRSVGGLIGEIANTPLVAPPPASPVPPAAVVTDSSASGNVTSTDPTLARAGGLVGNVLQAGAQLRGVQATGSVTATGNQVGGLIGTMNGSVLADAMASGDVTGSTAVGGLAGTSIAVITNSQALGDVSGVNFVGGLLGANSGIVADSSASGTVTGTGTSIGGLVGRNNVELSRSVASGIVSGATLVGGLVGENLGTIAGSHATGAATATTTGAGGLAGSTSGVVTDSYATGTVSATGGLAGGLVGSIEVGGSVARGFATGAVTGDNLVGGLAGSNAGTVTDAYATGRVTGASKVGGLIGEHVQGTVDRTYATGAVSGPSNVGGLVGSSAGGVTNSYWDLASSGQATSADGTGKTSAEMKQAATFAGWSIDNLGATGNTWRIYEGSTNPLLRSFLVAQTVANINRVYNAASQSGSAVVPLGARTGTAASGRNVGTYSAFSNQQGLDIVGGLLTITPAALSVSSVTANDKVYDGNTTATLNTGAASLAGVLGGDSVAINLSSATGSFADKNAGNAKAVTVSGVGLLTGADAGNYTVSSPSAVVANITPKALTVSGLTADNKVYDGNTIATLNTGAAALSGVIGGDTVTLGLSGVTGSFADKNVDNAKAVNLSGAGLLSGADAGNYSVSNPAGLVADITPKALTVSGITAGDKVYDGNTAATINTSGASYAGLVSGDALTVSSTGSFGDKNVVNGKTVTLTSSYSGADAGNYTITDQATTTASITPRALTVSGVTASDKVYDGTNAAIVNTAAAIYTGIVSGDSFAVSATGNFGDKNAATGKTVTLASSYSGADAGNYSITGQATTTASITPKALAVSGITASDKVYDGSTAATVNSTGAIYTGLIGGDDLSVIVTGAFADKHVATGKAVTLTGSYGGADAGNYAITGQTAATASITPAALTVTAQADNRVYDGTTASAAAPVITGTLYDTVASAATQAFDNKNAGMGKTLTAAGLVLADGNGGNNYNISYVSNGSGVITPASLSVVADNQARQIYTADPLLTYQTGPFAVGDTAASVLSGALQRVPGEQPGTYAINQGLLAANGNYMISYTPGSFTITAAPQGGSATRTPYEQAQMQTPLPVPEIRKLAACAAADGHGGCSGELPVRIVDEGLRMPTLASGPGTGRRD
ncbi:YDG domain-containing protein [Polaromonas sp.]|uniref:YDG domain-containing protein n=1 Tax=Polaromonas sp. TaxID=1869339 RepID=UPI003264CB9F